MTDLCADLDLIRQAALDANVEALGARLRDLHRTAGGLQLD